jgi:cell division protein FtsW (lipid II flippase)
MAVPGISGDRMLLAAVHLLTGIGFAILVSRPDPLRDSLLFVRYAQTATLGLGIMAALSCIDFTGPRLVDLSYVPLAGALSLSLLLVVFGSGPGASSAKVNLGPLQPVELTRLLLALFLAGYFARRWELLRLRRRMLGDRQLPAWINLPRPEYFLPVLVGVGAALLLFFLQKDLGPALLLCCVFLSPTVARPDGMAAAGLEPVVARLRIGFRLHVSNTLAERVRIWQSPWDTRRRAATRWHTRFGPSQPAVQWAPASVSATHDTCPPGTPISSWRPSARSSVSSDFRSSPFCSRSLRSVASASAGWRRATTDSFLRPS